jgi:hypothetical protein
MKVSIGEIGRTGYFLDEGHGAIAASLDPKCPRQLQVGWREYPQGVKYRFHVKVGRPVHSSCADECRSDQPSFVAPNSGSACVERTEGSFLEFGAPYEIAIYLCRGAAARIDILVPVFKLGQSPLIIQAEPLHPMLPAPRFLAHPLIPIPRPRPIRVQMTQIQYSQTVLLNFALLSWPHVSVATLVPSEPNPVPPWVW